MVGCVQILDVGLQVFVPLIFEAQNLIKHQRQQQQQQPKKTNDAKSKRTWATSLAPPPGAPATLNTGTWTCTGSDNGDGDGLSSGGSKAIAKMQSDTQPLTLFTNVNPSSIPPASSDATSNRTGSCVCAILSASSAASRRRSSSSRSSSSFFLRISSRLSRSAS